MRVGDPEYQRALDVISGIPSNKVDRVNLNNIPEDEMRDFEKRHLLELTEQARNMDIDEQIATARGLRIEVLHNAVGEYIEAQQKQNATIDNARSRE